MNDLKFALRQLLKNPGFTAVAVLTLALGIGANTAMFSLLNALLFQPLPYRDSGRIVRIFRTSPQSRSWPHSPANFLDRQTQNTVFSSSAAFSGWSFNLVEPGGPAERVDGVVATGDFFTTLGVLPVLGRVFGPAEDEPGLNRVVVISHGFWQRRFAGRSDAVGQTLRLDGEDVKVIGVMPPTFGHRLWGSVDVWKPIGWSAEERANRGNNSLGELARLKPGTSIRQAQAEMDGLAARLAEAYPAFNSGIGVRVVSLLESATDDSVRGLAWLATGLALMVLLIACANLANLQLARMLGRTRELAMRAALGASRGRMVRQLLIECLLLSLLGGLLGILLAAGSNQLLGRHQGLFNPQAGFAVPLDLRVLGFGIVSCVVTILISGLAPAWLATRAPLESVLRQAGRGAGGGRLHKRFRQALVAGEIALALSLLSGAGLFLRGLDRFAQRDPGWRLDGLMTAQIPLLAPAYEPAVVRQSFMDRLEPRLAALPWVRDVGFSSMLPLWGFGSRDFDVEGQPQGQPLPLMFYETVNGSFFRTMGVSLLEGRTFNSGDTTNRPAVVVINESMARHFWPGQSALGRRLGSGDPNDPHWEEVVGVVNDIRFPALLEPPDTSFQAYRPMTQSSPRWLSVLLRVEGQNEAMAADIRRVVSEIAPELPVAEIRTARSRLDESLANPALLGALLGAFAVLGLLLTGLGVYGVIAYSVAQRSHELGVRMALGASGSHLRSLVLRQGFILVLLGLLIGCFGSWAVARIMSNAAPELSSRDPQVIAVVMVLLVSAALLACWIPARRASRVDPMVALRGE
jgi:predicted permease